MVINRAIRRTIRHGGIGRIALDMTAGQYASAQGLDFVSRVLETINKYQRDGQLEVCTLRELATRWRPCQQVVTARSLLRVAA